MSDESRIVRIFGPPGTGKTTTLADRVHQTVLRSGPESICIASFSVTAAQEIANRKGVKGLLPPHAVGTLHSHAYRAIEHPPMALEPKVLAGWNDIVGPSWRITGQTRGPRGLESRDNAGTGSHADNGDGLLEQLDLLRARQAAPTEWPLNVRTFAKRWTGWKREVGAVDFSDMIVQAYLRARDGEAMPGNPSVLVADESQDMTPIEAALTREWGRQLGDDGWLVYALDDDQAIFDWRGGDPHVVLGLDARDEVLAQSYRVPPAVHAVAEAWIERCSTRYPKAYRPREASDRDASPAHSRGWAYRTGFALHDLALADSIERDLDDPDDPDATVMVIASCGYMLTALIKELKRRGVPFHNPFRPAEQTWNPLGPPGRGMSTAERVWRYCVLDERSLGARSRLWTGEDVAAWAALIDAKAAQLARGAKSSIDQFPIGTVPFELIAELFRQSPEGDEALQRATTPDLGWLAEVVVASKTAVTAYPLQVARSRGPAALMDPPRVVLGTIHSTKGAQADHVYLAPDLSSAGARQWRESQHGRDQIIRLFYVGATRAYHSLRVLAPGSPNTVPPEQLLPVELEIRA